MDPDMADTLVKVKKSSPKNARRQGIKIGALWEVFGLMWAVFICCVAFSVVVAAIYLYIEKIADLAVNTAETTGASLAVSLPMHVILQY
mmetsp:Transcript_42678/g.71127  ORF Transcript_42678/g.71127 Transcript_42678/m.71127 type:complete len:89 (-) Transcript_42678:226-492(-)